MKTGKALVYMLMAAILVSGLLGVQTAGLAGDDIGQPPSLPEEVKGHPKLESPLDQLVAAPKETRAAMLLPLQDPPAGADMVRVVLEAVPGSEAKVADKAQAFGGKVEATYDYLLQALMPVTQLEALANEESVRLVRLPYTPESEGIGEGVSVINASSWQNAGFRGKGTKVGILDVGFAGYESLLGTELPANPIIYWSSTIGGPGVSKHGTGIAEIIYDVAPEAQVYLVNFYSEVEWSGAVDWLIGQGVNVISSSIIFPNSGPGNGTGFINDAVLRARNAGVLFVQAAGNYADGHWSGTWLDGDGDSFQDFIASPRDEFLTVSAVAGEEIRVYLRWNDPWGGSANDYDLHLYWKSTGAFLATSGSVQNGNDYPREAVSYIAPWTGDYGIAIKRYAGGGVASFHVLSSTHEFNYLVASGSLGGSPADSRDALTVGAVPWSNPQKLEPFSSQGPTDDGRVKPDLVAPDGVTSVAYGRSFYGTSAATPHTAAAALLVKGRFPQYTPAQVQAYLEGRAVDLGAAGKDTAYGTGLVHLPVPDITSTWSKTFGDTAADISSSVRPTADGGYIITGYTYGSGNPDVWLVKTDASGNKAWDKTFGSTASDYGRAVLQTADGGYVVAGYTYSYGAGKADVWLIKTDINGNKLWDKTFGGAGSDYGLAVCAAPGGGYVVAGYTDSSGSGGTDIWLIKTDASGNKVWDKTFGSARNDYGYAVSPTLDGGYIIAGAGDSSQGDGDAWLVKTDATGNKLWERTLGGVDDQVALSVYPASDGGYVLAGYTDSYSGIEYDAWLVKTDAAGTKLWERGYGGPLVDYGRSVVQTPDGGYAIAGETASYGAGDYDAWLIRTDGNGNERWHETFGGSKNESGYSIDKTADGGFVMAGYTESYGAGGADVWLIKVNVTAIQYKLTVNIVGSGATTPVAGAVSYDGGTTVNIIATPAAGWKFAGWSGAVTSNQTSASVFMDADKVVTATFQPLVDINNDGKLDVLDLTMLERVIGGLETAPPTADVNNDGKVNALDITKLERLIAGLD
ncbi:MAG: S8 family serine peptidase [Chloroflexi bacterium]|nr:S8 family serine peptidase [Chloroflexota bacterium]